MKESTTQTENNKSSVVSVIVTVLTDALLIIAVAVLVIVMWARLSGDIPTIFGYSFHSVATSSMEPTIKTHSLIVVKDTDKEDIKVGDIILFHTDDPSWQADGIDLIVHRVKEIHNDDGNITFTTKGDNNSAQDVYRADDVVGIMVAQSYELGNFIYAVKDIIFFVAIAIMLFIALLVLIRIIKAVREGKYDEEWSKTNLSEQEIEVMKAEIRAQLEQSMSESKAENPDEQESDLPTKTDRNE